MLQLGLLLLLLQVLRDVRGSGTYPGWALVAPSKVRAVEGSCVVIPCSYAFPQTFRTIKTYHGLWKKGSKEVNVAATRQSYNIHPDYRGRTRILGPVWKNNCTWILKGVRPADTGLYFFRVELPEYKSFSWSFQPTELQVISPQPPQLDLTASEVRTEGEVRRDVMATCSVIHSCPLYPPAIIWSHNGTELSGARPMDDWQWWFYSSLSFSPSEEDFTRPLRCTTLYHRGLEISSTVAIVRRMPN